MGHSRADAKATKQKAKKFVRYKEGAEMYISKNLISCAHSWLRISVP